MSTEWPLWEVFIRGQHGMSHRHVGSLHAPDSEMAIKNARDVYTRRKEGLSIWVVESSKIVAADPSDKDSLYDPSDSKVYRHPTFFEIPEDAGKNVMNAEFEFLLRLGDNALVLGHRLSEWCGHAPVIEEDIALANVALDLMGQTQLWLGLAAERQGLGKTADNLAFLRDAWEFRNVLLVEQPNGDFGQTMMRQFLFDAWHKPYLQALSNAQDPEIAAIAAKSLKEVTYHLERSSDVVISLGDRTEESHARMQRALDKMWPYAGEMFLSDTVDAEMTGIAPDVLVIRAAFDTTVAEVMETATLSVPDSAFTHKAGAQARAIPASGAHAGHDAMATACLSGCHMVMTRPSVDQILAWLDDVPDPEIPVISLLDLGVIRDVKWCDETLEVTVTPTYSGCPATSVINMDIQTALSSRGVDNVRLKQQIAPPWTTDWLSEKGRKNLEAYGIAPPQPAGGPDQCPRCKSTNVEKISQFRSTPCKAQWRCTECLEPFDYFKCI